jgi:uncharacterized membrane protein YhaH (DUF805 family)
MNIQESVKTCFTKYADFTGRASRSEYWWFVLAEVIVLVVTGFIHQYVYTIAALAFLLPALAVAARRMHDMGKTGWLLLLAIIPLVNLILIYFLVQPTQPESNQWGAPPVA